MKLKLILALALGAITLPAAIIYQQDFEASTSVPSGFSGAGSIATTGGLSAFGFGANHLLNEGTAATTLTLTGLAPHTSVTLSFDLALWDSIDQGGDQFIVQADGIDLINTTQFGNYFGESQGPGTLLTPAFTGLFTPDFGRNNGFRDSARAVSITFAHTSSTLTLAWQFPNSQGSTDESFGIDNILVSDDSVPNTGEIPEPSTLALTAAAIGALLWRNRR